MSDETLSDSIAAHVAKGYSPLVVVLDRLKAIELKLFRRRQKLIAQARSIERPEDYEPTESDFLIKEHDRGQAEGLLESMHELLDFRIEIVQAILEDE